MPAPKPPLRHRIDMKPVRIVLTNIFLLFALSAYSQNVVDSLLAAFDLKIPNLYT